MRCTKFYFNLILSQVSLLCQTSKNKRLNYTYELCPLRMPWVMVKALNEVNISNIWMGQKPTTILGRAKRGPLWWEDLDLRPSFARLCTELEKDIKVVVEIIVIFQNSPTLTQRHPDFIYFWPELGQINSRHFLTKRSLTTIRSFLPRLFFAPSGAKNSLGRKDRPPHHYHSKCRQVFALLWAEQECLIRSAPP